MIKLRRSEDRGHANHGWLDTYHTFSFARYQDPEWRRFRKLRVINQDRVEPGKGFETHAHDNMEIITYVLEGEIAHKDSMGNGSTLPTHGIQRMSAGTGITHSEFNPSDTNPLELLQIWIFPAHRDITPSYQEGWVDPKVTVNQLLLVVSGEGRRPYEGGGGIGDTLGTDKPLMMHQDADLYVSRLEAGQELIHEIEEQRHIWVQLMEGVFELNGETLHPGDGAGVSDETQVLLKAHKDTHFLLFDLG